MLTPERVQSHVKQLSSYLLILILELTVPSANKRVKSAQRQGKASQCNSEDNNYHVQTTSQEFFGVYS